MMKTTGVKSFAHAARAIIVAIVIASITTPPSIAAIEPGPGSYVIKKGVFLVARESIKSPTFRKSVILLTHYGPSGTVGVIINKPMETKVSEALPGVEKFRERPDRLFFGGPVLKNSIVLLLRSKEKLPESYQVLDDVYFTSSVNALNHVLAEAEGETERRARVFAGYSGWAPGQLEHEINRGDWEVVKADAASVFDKDPEKLWQELTGPPPEMWIRNDKPEPALHTRRSSARPARRISRETSGGPWARNRLKERDQAVTSTTDPAFLIMSTTCAPSAFWTS